MRRQRLAGIVLVAFGLVAAPVSAMADDNSFTLDPPVTASGSSPFLGCTIGGPPGTVYPNTEVEPFIAVNPTNPDNLVGVYQQDRWSDGGARGLVASRSLDGGQTWSQNFAEFSDQDGQLLLDQKRMPQEYQWLIVARTPADGLVVGRVASA